MLEEFGAITVSRVNWYTALNLSQEKSTFRSRNKILSPLNLFVIVKFGLKYDSDLLKKF